MSIPFSAASFLASGLAATCPPAATGGEGADWATEAGAGAAAGAEGAGAAGGGGGAALGAAGAAVKSLKAATSPFSATITHSACKHKHNHI